MSQSEILTEFDLDYNDISRDNIGDRTLLQHYIFKPFQQLLKILIESKGSTHHEVASRLQAMPGIDIDASKMYKSRRKHILSRSYCFAVKNQQELIPETENENTLSIIIIHDIQDGSFGIYSGTKKGKHKKNPRLIDPVRFVDELTEYKNKQSHKIGKWLQCFDQDPDRFRLYVWSKCDISSSSSVAEIIYENAAIRLFVWIITKYALEFFYVINIRIQKTKETLQCFYTKCIRKYHHNSWDEYYSAINVQSKSAEMLGPLLLLSMKGYNSARMKSEQFKSSTFDPNNADNVVSIWNSIHYTKTDTFCDDCNQSLKGVLSYNRIDDDQVLHKNVHRIDNLMSAIRSKWNQIRLEGDNNPTLNALWTKYIGSKKNLFFKVTKFNDKRKYFAKISLFGAINNMKQNTYFWKLLDAPRYYTNQYKKLGRHYHGYTHYVKRIMSFKSSAFKFNHTINQQKPLSKLARSNKGITKKIEQQNKKTKKVKKGNRKT